ncbi:hypothetical protein MBLNU459_g4374t2 [Dothideomycetes sp. NU459]
MARGSPSHSSVESFKDVVETNATTKEAMLSTNSAVEDEHEQSNYSTGAISPDQAGTEPRPDDIEKSAATASHNPAESAPAAFDPRENPDGGLAACFGWINCIGVFQDYYQTHQLKQYSPSTVAWIPSLETFMMFFIGPFIGYAYDGYGPRWILVAGTFFHVFGIMMTSLATEYYQFILAQGICSAAGASMCFYPAMSALPTWFFRRRAAAFGLAAAGSSIGGVIFPIMVSRLVPRIGFGWAMRCAGFLILALMIIANLTVKSRLPPHPKPFGIRQFIQPLTEMPFFLTTLGCFCFFFGLFLPINFIILQARSLGMSARLASYLIPILNGASFFGRVLPGIVADKVGRFNTMIFMCFFTGIIVFALWIPAAANAPIIVFAILYGFGSGSFVSLAPSLVAQISDVREIGVRNGTLFAIISFAALCGNPIGGAIVNSMSGRYLGLQIFCGVMCLAGATSILGARIVLAGLKPTVKV